MTTTALGILVAAGLFALFGWLKPRGCDGRCPGCTTGSCQRAEPGDRDAL